MNSNLQSKMALVSGWPVKLGSLTTVTYALETSLSLHTSPSFRRRVRPFWNDLEDTYDSRTDTEKENEWKRWEHCWPVKCLYLMSFGIYFSGEKKEIPFGFLRLMPSSLNQELTRVHVCHSDVTQRHYRTFWEFSTHTKQPSKSVRSVNITHLAVGKVWGQLLQLKVIHRSILTPEKLTGISACQQGKLETGEAGWGRWGGNICGYISLIPGGSRSCTLQESSYQRSKRREGLWESNASMAAHSWAHTIYLMVKGILLSDTV